jgi:hypothetical protein
LEPKTFFWHPGLERRWLLTSHHFAQACLPALVEEFRALNAICTSIQGRVKNRLSSVLKVDDELRIADSDKWTWGGYGGGSNQVSTDMTR